MSVRLRLVMQPPPACTSNCQFAINKIKAETLSTEPATVKILSAIDAELSGKNRRISIPTAKGSKNDLAINSATVMGAKWVSLPNKGPNAAPQAGAVKIASTEAVTTRLKTYSSEPIPISFLGSKGAPAEIASTNIANFRPPAKGRIVTNSMAARGTRMYMASNERINNLGRCQR